MVLGALTDAPPAQIRLSRPAAVDGSAQIEHWLGVAMRPLDAAGEYQS
jgi:hypothetical protein